MRRDQIVSYFFIAFFLFVLYQLILIFSPFFAALSWAAILAFAFYPIYRRIQTSAHIPPAGAAVLSTVLVVLIVVIPAAFAIVSLMKEAIDLYSQTSNYITAGNLHQLIENIRFSLKSQWAEEHVWPVLGPVQDEVTNWMLGTAKNVGNTAAHQLASLTKNLFFWALNLVLIAVLLFFFFRDGKLMYDFVYRMIPMTKKNKNILAARVDETFSAVIRGQLVTCVVQGTLAGLTFWMLSLPIPFLIGFLTFIGAMIPVCGAASVWAPFAVYLFIVHQYTKAIILTVIGTFVISLADNLLKPLLIGEKAKLPIFLLFLGILGGVNLYGFTGVFIGPVLISLFFALAQIYREEYHSET